MTLTAGMYNKIGAENDRVDDTVPRGLGQFTYLGRAATFISLSDAHSLDVGLSYAYTPQVEMEQKAQRHLAGLDVTYRYVPLSQAGYRGLVWGTEVLLNSERRPIGGFSTDPTALPPTDFKRNNAWGLYSYLEARLTRRFYPGFLFDYAQALDSGVGDTKAYCRISRSGLNSIACGSNTPFLTSQAHENQVPPDGHSAMCMASVIAMSQPASVL